MHLMTSLLLLIVVARLLGQLFSRLGQPAIIGEMLAGVLLGPSVFNMVRASPGLSGVAELAIFLVILSAGLEMNYKDVIGAFKGRGGLLALIGFLGSFVAGILLGTVFDLGVTHSVFLGLCLSITALPVSVRILQSFDLLDSEIAKYSIATAVFTDVVALLVLGVLLNLPEQKSFYSVAIAIFSVSWKFVIFGAVIIGINYILDNLIDGGIHIEKFPEKIVKVFGNEALFGILVLFVLVFGSISENLGFHFIIGAFFGSLLIDRKFFLVSRYRELERTLNSVSSGFLAPVFFAFIGLEFNISAIQSVGFMLAVFTVSILSKVLSGWIGGRLAGLHKNTSVGIGIILNSRGSMDLVIASIAYERGFIDQGLFSVLVLLAIVATILTPVLFQKFVVPSLALPSPTKAARSAKVIN